MSPKPIVYSANIILGTADHQKLTTTRTHLPEKLLSALQDIVQLEDMPEDQE